MRSLEARAWLALTGLAVVLGLLLFVPAASIRYWQAWFYLSVFIGASAVVTLDLIRTDRALLERRMRGGPRAEKRPAQRVIMLGTSIGFAALHIVPGLDHRFGWSAVPTGAVLGADLFVGLGFLLVGRVYRANTFAAATIEVAADHRLISTGPYAIVRHPMYASASPYLLATPLALGSYWGFVPIAAMMPLLVWRLLDEERLLAADLPGYTDYQQRVSHRLVPFVW